MRYVAVLRRGRSFARSREVLEKDGDGDEESKRRGRVGSGKKRNSMYAVVCGNVNVVAASGPLACRLIRLRRFCFVCL